MDERITPSRVVDLIFFGLTAVGVQFRRTEDTLSGFRVSKGQARIGKRGIGRSLAQKKAVWALVRKVVSTVMADYPWMELVSTPDGLTVRESPDRRFWPDPDERISPSPRKEQEIPVGDLHDVARLLEGSRDDD